MSEPTDTYLDEIEDREIETPKGLVREPYVVQGTPVNMSVHGASFRHKPPEVKQATPTYPPRVPARPAAAEEIPAEAARAATACRARGLAVRVTYAQSGAPIEYAAPRGTCFCGAKVLLYAEDGTLRDHLTPDEKCAGYAALYGFCVDCGAKVKAKKDGSNSAHKRPRKPCTGGREAPGLILRGEEKPPAWSVQVIAPGGAGVWTNGDFDFAIIEGSGKVGADEYQKWCKG